LRFEVGLDADVCDSWVGEDGCEGRGTGRTWPTGSGLPGIKRFMSKEETGSEFVGLLDTSSMI
jgi:hypothetical protein